MVKTSSTILYTVSSHGNVEPAENRIIAALLRAMVGARSKPMFEAEAKERQTSTQAAPGHKVGEVRGEVYVQIGQIESPNESATESEPRKVFANLQKPTPVHVAVKAAEMVNVSPRSVEMAS